MFCGWINWKAVHVAVWEGVRLPPRWFGVDPPTGRQRVDGS